MNARISGLVLSAVVGVLGGALGCVSNPTSDGSGTPAQVLSNFQSLLIPRFSTSTFRASVVDSRLTPLATPVTFGSCNGSVATAVSDPTYAPPAPTSYQAVVTGVTLGQTCVTASASGLKTDTVAVSILPLIFEGTTWSSSTPLGGGPVTIHTGPALKFTAGSSITWPNGETATQLVNTPDSVTVIALFGGSGAATVTAVNTTYLPDPTTTFTLKTATGVTTTGRFWAGDTAAATAPALTLPAPGGTGTVITNLSGASNAASCADSVAVGAPLGPCMFYTLTVADTFPLHFTMDWDGSPADSTHLVAYLCPSPYNIATCQAARSGSTFMGGRSSKGAYPARPLSTTASKFAAGTYYFVIEQRTVGGVGGVAPSNITVKIKH